MTMQLQPVSDLQRTQRFDDFDLTANRAGSLSGRQRRNILWLRLLEHTIGALVVLLAVALIINLLQFTFSSVELFGVAIGVFLLLTVALWIYRTRSTLMSPVRSAEGILALQSPVVLGGAPFDEIAIGKVLFYVRPEVFDVLDEGAVYKVYYLERRQHLGGNVLLSAEVIKPAPLEDDYDDEE
jgi:hypothetical protein